ncbi:hypothetical protein GPOL_174p00290 (plasmid) [Gordonia polyisoprenivorans VH2]|uniref:Uncharacterized protein n=1 Tax=Gordonia polyisoprenivorans (strain DSM 44266 / VH2) TaxID=1112204 RepID=H6N505_GORPV|nr:hypothetical protein GPOL_174p00290 [Gordonia polyisoprenivorans VH2]
MIGERAQRVKPEAFLPVWGGVLFVGVCVTKVASRSMINGCRTSRSWLGAAVPAAVHACARAAARAALIADKAAGASVASVEISRDTVGSEATGPNTPGSARTWLISANQSPPRATAMARSSRILPGS